MVHELLRPTGLGLFFCSIQNHALEAFLTAARAHFQVGTATADDWTDERGAEQIRLTEQARGEARPAVMIVTLAHGPPAASPPVAAPPHPQPCRPGSRNV